MTSLEAQEPAPIPKVIDHYARVFKVNPQSLKDVMICESGGNFRAFNKSDPNGGSRGLYQFQPRTWEVFSKEAQLENPDIWNPNHQILVTAWAFSKDRQSHWSCAKKLGLIP